jgi:hypothetical protein
MNKKILIIKYFIDIYMIITNDIFINSLVRAVFLNQFFSLYLFRILIQHLDLTYFELFILVLKLR